jgi:hypothetical protein
MVLRLKREGRSLHQIADVVERSVAAIEMRLRRPRPIEKKKARTR